MTNDSTARSMSISALGLDVGPAPRTVTASPAGGHVGGAQSHGDGRTRGGEGGDDTPRIQIPEQRRPDPSNADLALFPVPTIEPTTCHHRGCKARRERGHALCR
jgi:hypothetical protein